MGRVHGLHLRSVIHDASVYPIVGWEPREWPEPALFGGQNIPKMPTTTNRWRAYIRRSRAISWSSQRRSYEASTSPLDWDMGTVTRFTRGPICQARELANADRFDYASTSKLPPFACPRARSSRDQSPCSQSRLRQIRKDFHRRRRLDIRTLARRVLPGKTRAGQRAAIRGLETHLDRDQRHLLRLPEAGEFSQVGAGSTGRLCLLVERARALPPTAACWRKPATP